MKIKKRERWSAKRIGARVRDEGRAVYLWYNLWMAQPRYTANLNAAFFNFEMMMFKGQELDIIKYCRTKQKHQRSSLCCNNSCTLFQSCFHRSTIQKL